jgi:hypothetical protein
VIALVLVPIAPPGLPILAAIAGVVAAGRQTPAVIEGAGDE